MVSRGDDGHPASSTWRTFWAGHAKELWVLDLTTQPLWDYSVRYVLVLMELRNRRIVHVAVTASPTLAWLKQRIRGATPFGSVPRFIVLFLSEDHFRRTVLAYIAYYNEARPHQGIEGIPEFGPGSPRATLQETGDIPIKAVAHPVLGGLHHDYRRAA